MGHIPGSYLTLTGQERISTGLERSSQMTAERPERSITGRTMSVRARAGDVAELEDLRVRRANLEGWGVAESLGLPLQLAVNLLPSRHYHGDIPKAYLYWVTLVRFRQTVVG